jgi:hypothetical protein
MTHDIAIDERTAKALRLTSLDGRAVANRLAEIAELAPPTRDETIEFLVEVLRDALKQISNTWSWGEFHNGGTQPLYDIGREKDWHRLAVCAVDLGLDAQPARVMTPDEVLSPRDALARNLGDATDRLLREVKDRLEAAGVSPYGQPTPRA